MINYLPKWMYHFIVPSAMNKFILLHIFTAFDVVGALDFGHSNGCVEVSHCCFTLSFSDDI